MSEPKRLFLRLTYPTTRARKLSPGAPPILRLKTDARGSGEPAPDAGLLGDVSNDKQRARNWPDEFASRALRYIWMTPVSGCVRAWCGWGCASRRAGCCSWLICCARRPPAAVVTKARSLFTRILRCCATPAIRWLSRRRAFAGHFRSRRLRFTPLRMGKAVPAMPSCSAGRWANNNEGMSMLFSPLYNALR